MGLASAALVRGGAEVPDGALADLEALPRDRIQTHQPWWPVRARIAERGGDRALGAEGLARAIALTEDAAAKASRKISTLAGLQGRERSNPVPSTPPGGCAAGWVSATRYPAVHKGRKNASSTTA